ncbi:MAG: DUF3990 domain-containing protein [Clostridia bacterium]|nr:DUF3990 domain-containing protein [Clostridia bacterium]
MNVIKLYHGSEKIVEQPQFGKGKAYNDYGRGFYCTESIELAKEWACNENESGFANCYELDIDGLKILNLSDEKYTILNWIALLTDNRRVRVSTPIMRRAIEWLRENYLIDISEYDVIVGYRADDAYFSFARAFVNNEISLSQLSYAMRLGKLGEQWVIKSERAFERLKFVSYERAECDKYYPLRKARGDEAREAFEREAEKDDLNGIYIRDLMREGGQNNARL